MADLAGTAVGIISLGLQLCQGIVSYSEAWRGYDEEIQNTNNKAKALRTLLKTLRDTIEDLQETRPEVAADLEEKAMSMHSSIEKLRKIVERFKPARSEAFPEKVRAQLKKSVYYFQRDSLQDMQNHLDQIQNVLQTSLLIYNWQDTMESRAMQISMYEEMRSMHSTLKDAISSTGMPSPSVLQFACDSQLKQLPMMLSDSEPMAQTNLGVVSEKGSLTPKLLSAFSKQQLSPYDTFYEDGHDGIEYLMDGSMAIYETWLAMCSRDFIKIMDSMYEIGFHDVDMPNQDGVTPLMAFAPFKEGAAPVMIKCAAWLMSKGASIERRMPTSNAKVAHFCTSQVINIHYMEAQGELASSNFENWKKRVAELGNACFFVSPIQDCCICGCSPGGCTTLSVALRLIIWRTSQWRSEIQDHDFRKTILSLIAWQDSWPDISQAIVRTLTFDALGLTHTCCTELNSFEIRYLPFQAYRGRDETEIDRILDDQHLLLKEFEELMEEMERKLDELDLPLEEFLDGYWYGRVIEYLSRRDQYNEVHVTEARMMGVFLEAEEFCIPDRVSLRFRPRVQELQDDSLLNGPG
ncbi:hypothetical protein LT330_005737 [Penicillium expansum]|nr:hypothetical protein LT330_005737 [Penicillium expansum]